MNIRMNRRTAAVALLSLGLAARVARAEDSGVTATSVAIGRVMPTGSPAFGAMARQHAGRADACIAAVNAQGGIGGRRIVLHDRDDGYDAARAREQTRSLIEDDKVFALLGAVGTPTLPPIMELADRFGVPLVGAASVGNEARLPARRFVFPVRMSASGEASAIVRHQATVGSRRFVVLSSKEAYGPAGAAAFNAALRDAGFAGTAIAFGALDDPRKVARQLLAAAPDAILISVVPRPFAAVARQYDALGGHARMVGLSVIRIEDLAAELGTLAEGIALSQVLPSPLSHASTLSADFRRALATHAPAAVPSYHALEGYLEARVLVEGLRRAGAELSRSRLVFALESIAPHDFGGVLVRYGPADRTGSTFSDLVMLAANGRTVS
jgi:ABC-type branched-subunit amino acid transport system substrate-binding protein